MKPQSQSSGGRTPELETPQISFKRNGCLFLAYKKTIFLQGDHSGAVHIAVTTADSLWVLGSNHDHVQFRMLCGVVG